ncbi:unnamed protein product [Rhizoctonia solani]|uniref:Uncharacterized protein n=1 Tax=Rhizoctonia solani TaxID=456999 RepID=A0A8H3BB68_9AGAM|nr:unnamed protein product [Rhizoctonia solani]
MKGYGPQKHAVFYTRAPESSTRAGPLETGARADGAVNSGVAAMALERTRRWLAGTHRHSLGYTFQRPLLLTQEINPSANVPAD